MPGCDDWTLAQLGKQDRFFLAVHLLNRADLAHPWLYARCREVELNSDGYLDLWAREHGKSSLITNAGMIQEILRDPEITIGIFSHTKPISRKFLLQTKQEFESNDRLISLYPDVLYKEPRKESPKWSEEKGIVVKRLSNPREATVEAWGLVDGQPTGAHFMLRIYDDVVTRESVSTQEQIDKTTSAFELSDNLGARGADGRSRSWAIGTRYHFQDTYATMIERGALIPRVYPATDDGSPDGTPVFLSRAAWAEKKVKQGPATIACQQLQNPLAGDQAMFKKSYLSFTEIRPSTLNIYIMIDPASSKKRGSDSTAMVVVGIDAQRVKYLLDGYHHKMSLQERWTAIKNLRRHWQSQPGIQNVSVGYERYGMRSDLEYFEERMEIEKDYFSIKELAWPNEGPGSKFDRIQRLEPDFRNGRFFLIAQADQETSLQAKTRESGQSFRVLQPIRRKDHTGKAYNLTLNFVQQFLAYPFVSHDDLIDATSRIYDLDPRPPVIIDDKMLEPAVYADGS